MFVSSTFVLLDTSEKYKALALFSNFQVVKQCLLTLVTLQVNLSE
jgi:hypothetical protein